MVIYKSRSVSNSLTNTAVASYPQMSWNSMYLAGTAGGVGVARGCGSGDPESGRIPSGSPGFLVIGGFLVY